MRDAVMVLVGGMALSLVGGCGDVEWNWGSGTSRPVRAAPQPIHPATRPAGRDATASMPSGAADPIGQGQDVGYHQLILLSGASAGEVGQVLRPVRLRNAGARQVGVYLAMLFIPAGPSGTEKRYALLYPTATECRAASRWAPLLDLPAIEEGDAGPPDDPRLAFSFGMGVLYGTSGGDRESRARWQMAVASLTRTVADPGEAATRRWAAGMIAGTVLAERCADYDEAQRRYEAAEALVPASSYEQMMSRYSRARVCVHKGEFQQARELLAGTVAQFGAFKDSEVFVRVQELLASLQRGP